MRPLFHYDVNVPAFLRSIVLTLSHPCNTTNMENIKIFIILNVRFSVGIKDFIGIGEDLIARWRIIRVVFVFDENGRYRCRLELH